MKQLCSVLISTVMFAGLVVPVHAASKLVTPRLTSGTGDLAFCNVVNAGNKPITVTIEMMNFDGTTITGPSDVTLGPDQSTSITALGFHTFHCVYTGAFPKQNVRANATVSSDFRSIVSVPAE